MKEMKTKRLVKVIATLPFALVIWVSMLIQVIAEVFAESDFLQNIFDKYINWLNK